VYSWIADISNKTGSGVTYDTCNPYMACSAESDDGFCGAKEVDGAWDCKPENVCRTCSTFTASGGECVEVDKYPNATVVEHGDVSGADNMAKEIMARGPIACGVDANPLLNYTGGVISTPGKGVDHIVSVIGWGKDKDSGKSYWQYDCTHTRTHMHIHARAPLARSRAHSLTHQPSHAATWCSLLRALCSHCSRRVVCFVFRVACCVVCANCLPCLSARYRMRNSWGEFWGEMGYAKVEKGSNALMLEGGCNWAVPDSWTDMEDGGNTACDEGGENCNEHLPPPPPLNCEAFCSKKSIAMCSQFGMHCVCGDKQYNTTHKGMPHGTSCSGHPGCSGQCNATAPPPADLLVLPGFV
jgi:hypothetical protein